MSNSAESLEPSRNRRRNIGIGATIVCLVLFVVLWRNTELARAELVAVAFIEAVQRGNFAEAANYWRDGDIANIEANWQMPFDQFCIQRFKCEKYTLTRPRRDKKSYVLFYEGEEAGRIKKFGLFLRRIDGRWQLLHDKWLE